MSGGVREIVADNYAVHYYDTSPRKNPTGPAEKSFEIAVRGGAYDSTEASEFRVYARVSQAPKGTNGGVGFRCAKSASDTTPVRAGASEPKASSPKGVAGKSPSAEMCADPCALLTAYAYDDLVANACKICKAADDTSCQVDFPFNDVPSCDAYDELRNCIFARFGYVFSKPKWQQQFGKAPWYKPDPNFTEAKLQPPETGTPQRQVPPRDRYPRDRYQTLDTPQRQVLRPRDRYQTLDTQPGRSPGGPLIRALPITADIQTCPLRICRHQRVPEADNRNQTRCSRTQSRKRWHPARGSRFLVKFPTLQTSSPLVLRART